MAGTKISEATLRSTLKGTESIPLVDTDLPKGKTTTANLKTYCTPDLSGYAEKTGAEFTGAVGTTQMTITRPNQGAMAAILANSNDIQFRTMNAGVDSMTFNVQYSTPLKITEAGILENGTLLSQKYALLTDLDQLATKTEVQDKLDTSIYNQDKATFATKTELSAKVGGTGVTKIQVVTELPESPDASTLYIVTAAEETA